ncbi:MAG: XisI protein [Leptolyngbyaceae cyanobacterium CSU_1_3]|nr:XisI protein [Leptolyngbyaceae cyanobacterium CSU_1_3]
MESQSSVTLTHTPLIAHEACQQAVIETLLEAIPDQVIPDTLKIVPLFDLHYDRYQLLCQGWTEGEKRVFYPVIHIELIEDKVWIQHNHSDRDIGAALCDRGIPQSQIVLGLHPPSIRQLNPEYGS